jgi:hypothetical protein
MAHPWPGSRSRPCAAPGPSRPSHGLGALPIPTARHGGVPPRGARRTPSGQAVAAAKGEPRTDEPPAAGAARPPTWSPPPSSTSGATPPP